MVRSTFQGSVPLPLGQTASSDDVLGLLEELCKIPHMDPGHMIADSLLTDRRLAAISPQTTAQKERLNALMDALRSVTQNSEPVGLPILCAQICQILWCKPTEKDEVFLQPILWQIIKAFQYDGMQEWVGREDVDFRQRYQFVTGTLHLPVNHAPFFSEPTVPPPEDPCYAVEKSMLNACSYEGHRVVAESLLRSSQLATACFQHVEQMQRLSALKYVLYSVMQNPEPVAFPSLCYQICQILWCDSTARDDSFLQPIFPAIVNAFECAGNEKWLVQSANPFQLHKMAILRLLVNRTLFFSDPKSVRSPVKTFFYKMVTAPTLNALQDAHKSFCGEYNCKQSFMQSSPSEVTVQWASALLACMSKFSPTWLKRTFGSSAVLPPDFLAHVGILLRQEKTLTRAEMVFRLMAGAVKMLTTEQEIAAWLHVVCCVRQSDPANSQAMEMARLAYNVTRDIMQYVVVEPPPSSMLQLLIYHLLTADKPDFWHVIVSRIICENIRAISVDDAQPIVNSTARSVSVECGRGQFVAKQDATPITKKSVSQQGLEAQQRRVVEQLRLVVEAQQHLLEEQQRLEKEAQRLQRVSQYLERLAPHMTPELVDQIRVYDEQRTVDLVWVLGKLLGLPMPLMIPQLWMDLMLHQDYRAQVDALCEYVRAVWNEQCQASPDEPDMKRIQTLENHPTYWESLSFFAKPPQLPESKAQIQPSGVDGAPSPGSVLS